MVSYQDIRYSFRTLTGSPGLAILTVLTLALGIGANTAIFTLVNALLLRRLAVPNPKELVQITAITRNGGTAPLSFAMLRELEERQRVFAAVFGASGSITFNVEVNGTLFLGGVRAVTGNYFSELGAIPLVGRLVDSVDADRKARVAVISYDFWDRRFGRDQAIIGKSIQVEGRLFTVIGVTPQWFTGLTPGEPPEVVVPVTASPFEIENHSLLWLSVVGRLSDGITIERARVQLQSAWPELLAASAG